MRCIRAVEHSQGNHSRRRAKVTAYLVAWAAALFATDPSLRLWSLAWMFPIGLFAWIPENWKEAGRVWLAFGFLLYFVHAVFYFRARGRTTGYILFAVLIVLLLANVGGCRSMNHYP